MGFALPLGRTLPANNRVTSWKPLTAAGELVSAEGVRRRLRERQRSAFARRCVPACVRAVLSRVSVLCSRAGAKWPNQCGLQGYLEIGARIMW